MDAPVADMINLPKMMAYHQSGTCGYFDIKRAWMSSCSDMERRTWVQICLRKKRNACVMVAVIEAKERP